MTTDPETAAESLSPLSLGVDGTTSPSMTIDTTTTIPSGEGLRLDDGATIILGGEVDFIVEGSVEASRAELGAVISSEQYFSRLYVQAGGLVSLENGSINLPGWGSAIYVRDAGELRVRGGELAGNWGIHIEAGGVLNLEGTALRNDLILETGSTAVFRDCSFDGHIQLGNAAIEASGTLIFNHAEVLIVNDHYSGNLGDLWRGAEVIASEGAYITLGTVIDTATLAALPAAFTGGYRAGGNMEVAAGHTLTLEEGALLHLNDYLRVSGTVNAEFSANGQAFITQNGAYGSFDISETGRMNLVNVDIDLSGENSQIIVAGGGEYSMRGGTLLLNPELGAENLNIIGNGLVNLEGVAVQGNLNLGEEVQFSAADCSFSSYLMVDDTSHALSATLTFGSEETFRLRNFSGTTADLWDGVEIIAPENAYIGLDWELYTTTLSALPPSLQGGYRLRNNTFVVAGEILTLEEGAVIIGTEGLALTVEGTLIAHWESAGYAMASDPNCPDLFIRNGGLVSLENAGISLPEWGSAIYVQAGGELRMKGGELISNWGIHTENGGVLNLEGTHLKNDLILDAGSTATLKDCTLDGHIQLADTSVRFEGDITFTSPEVIVLENFSGDTNLLWQNASFNAPEGACVLLRSSIKTATLGSLPPGMGERSLYQTYGETTVAAGHTLTLEDGGVLALYSQFIVEGTFRAACEQEFQAVVAMDGVFARFDVRETGCVELENVNLRWGVNHEILVHQGGSFTMTGGALATDPLWDETQTLLHGGGSVTFNGVRVEHLLRVGEGMELIVNGSTFASAVELTDSTSDISGSFIFTSEETFRLNNFSGSTAELWGKVEITAPQDAYVSLAGTLQTATLTALPQGGGTYRISATELLMLEAGHTLTLAEGVHIQMQENSAWLIEGDMTAALETPADVVTSSSNFARMHVQNGGSLSLDNANLSLSGWGSGIYVRDGGTLTMKGGELVSNWGTHIEADGTLCLDGTQLKDDLILDAGSTATLKDCVFDCHVQVAGTTTNFEGSVTFLQQEVFVLEGFSGNTDDLWDSARFTAPENSYIGLRGTICTATLTRIEGGPSSYRLLYDTRVAPDQTLTLAEGVCVNLQGAILEVEGTLEARYEEDAVAIYSSSATACFYVREGGRVLLENAGIRLLNDQALTYVDSGAELCLRGGVADTRVISDGKLEAEGVLFTSAITAAAGSLNLTGCTFASGIDLVTGLESATITGADLSGTTIRIFAGETAGGMIDLSGNYWGTTDLEEIKSMIVGYDESCVIIDGWLSSPPDTPQDTQAPELTLLRPIALYQEDGRTLVTFEWSCNEKATYELAVDGEVIYRGSDLRFTTLLSPGTHCYTLTATDTFGNSSVTEEAVLESHAPASWRIEVTNTSLDSRLTGSLAWAIEQANSYRGEETPTLCFDESLAGQTIGGLDSSGSYPRYRLGSMARLEGPAGGSVVLDVVLEVLKDEVLSIGSGVAVHTITSNGMLGFDPGSVLTGVLQLGNRGKLVMSGARIDGALELYSGAELYGDNCVFTGSGDVISLYDIALDLSHFRAEATSPDATISIPGGVLYADISLTPLGNGLETYRLRDALLIQSGATLRLEEGACLRSDDYGYDIEVNTDGCLQSNGGRIELLGHSGEEGGDLSGLIVRTGGEALLTDTTIVGYPSESSSGAEEYNTIYVNAGGKLELDNCNLVDVTKFHVEDGARLSLRETDVYDVYVVNGEGFRMEGGTVYGQLRIDGGGGYVENVHFENPPIIESDTPPTFVNCVGVPLTLHDPLMKKLGQGLMEVTLVWSGHDEFASYVLEVAGQQMELEALTTYTLTLSDGNYSYRVTMTDTEGKVYSSGDTFVCDTISPTLELLKPSFTQAGEGEQKVRLSWSCGGESNIYYEVQVNGELRYAGYDEHCEVTLKDGEHHYTVTARDASGNSAGISGAFVSDSTLSGLGMEALLMHKVEDGLTEVSFSWVSNGAAGYLLEIDGKPVDVEGTEYTCTLSDGLHHYRLSMTDAAGNLVSAEGSFVSDATAPVVGLNKPTMQQLGDGLVQVTLSWYSNENADYELLIQGERYSLSGTSHTLTLPAGEHGYTLIATDSRGNSSTQEGSFTIDLTPPELTLHAPQTEKVREGVTQVTLSWSCSKEATYELWVDDQLLYRDTEPGYSFDAPDGEHHYELRATDALGTSVTVTGDSLVLDATAPQLTLSSPLLVSLEGGLSDVTFRWSSDEENVTYLLEIDGQEVYRGPDTETTLTLPEGSYSYRVTVMDAAGNRSEQESSLSFSSSAPELELYTPLWEKVGEGRISVTLSWEGEEGLTYTVVMDGEEVYSGPESDITLELPDGEHSYSVTASNGINGTITLDDNFLSDATSPELSLGEPDIRKIEGEDGLVQVTLSWEGDEEDLIYTLTLNGEVLHEGPETEWTLELEDGSYSYSVSAADPYDNTSEVVTGSFLCDTSAPEVQLDAPQTERIADGLSRVTFSWSCSEEATYELTVNDVCYRDLTGNSFTLELEDGEHSYSLKAIDTSEHANSAETEERSLTLDATAPVAAFTGLQFKKLAEGLMEVSFSWECDEEATFELTVDGVTYSGITTSGYSLELADGEHSYSLKATDAAGNSSETQGEHLWVDATAPHLSLAAPRTRKLGEGQTEATFSWESEAGAGYELTLGDTTYTFSTEDGGESYSARVNGEEAPDIRLTVGRSGTSYSCTLTLPDGEMSYSLKATDAAGNETEITAEDLLILDTTAPVVTFSEPQIIKDEDREGLSEVTLSWQSDEEANYTLYVDGKKQSAANITLSEDGRSAGCTLTLKDGTHSYYVKATDSFGNSITTEKESIVLDATAPTLTLAAPTYGEREGDMTQVTFSWTSSEKADYSFRLGTESYLIAEGEEGGYTVRTPDGKELEDADVSILVSDDGRKVTCTLTLAEGDYPYSVTATDAFENRAESSELLLDLTPPELVLHEPEATNRKAGKATVTFRWEVGEDDSVSSYELTIIGGGKTTKVKLKGNKSEYVMKNLSDAYEYSISLKAVDTHGNTVTRTYETEDGAGYSFDATAPAVETGEPLLEKEGGLTTVTFHCTSSEAALYTLHVTGKSADGEKISQTIENFGGTEYATEATGSLTLEDGSYFYTITATDAAGNPYTTPSQSFRCDATAPEVQVSKQTLTPIKGSHEEKLSLSWSANEKVSVYSLSLGKLGEEEEDIALPKAGSTGYSGTFEDGVYTYTITAEDTNGNIGTTHGSFVVDTTAPEFSLSRPVVDSVEDGVATLSLRWSSGEEFATCTLTVDGRKVKLEEAAANGSYSWQYDEETGLWDYSYTTSLSGGSHEYRVTGADADGNSDMQTGSFYLDATTPAAPKLSKPKVEKAGEGLLTVTLSWTGEVGASYSVDIEDENGVRTTAVYEGFDPRCVLTLPDGNYTYTITARDAAGNPSKPSATGKYSSFGLDATAPVVESTNLHMPEIARAKSGKASVTFSWDEVEEGATYTLMVDGKSVYSGKGNSKTLKLADGEHHYSLIVTDKAGNSSEVEGMPISIDAVAPKVTLAAPVVSYAEGSAALVTLAWESTEHVTCELSIEGEDVSYTILSPDGGKTYKACTADGAEAPELELVVRVEGLQTTCTLLLADGSYRYSLTATDSAVDALGAPIGNSTTTKAASLLVDSSRDAATGAVSLKAVKPTKSADGRIRVTLGWTAPKDAKGKAIKGLTYTLRVDGAIVYTGSSTSRTLVLDDLVSGPMHSYSVTATDTYGNSIEVVGESFGLDTSAPVLTELTAASAQAESDSKGRSQVTLSWKGEEATTYTIQVGNKTYTNPEFTREGDVYSFTAPDLFGDMSCKYSITVADGTDKNANKLTYSGSVLIDTKGPKVTLSKPVLAAAAGGMVKATLGWKSEKGATYELTVDGTTYRLCSEDGGESYSITTAEGKPATGISYSLSKDGKTLSCTLQLSDGTHSYSVTAWDASGNPSEAPATGSFSYDTTAPDIILTEAIAVQAELTSKGKVSTRLSWEGEADVTYTVLVDGKSYSRGKSTSHSLELAQGAHSYIIIAKDAAGNSAVYSTTLTVSLVDGTPELTWSAADTQAATSHSSAQVLGWEADDSEGIHHTESTAGGYSFELTEARTVNLKLSGLGEDTTLLVQREGGQGSIELSAAAGTTLDRELNLSAGTYYLNVEGSNSGELAAYTLDLELVKDKNNPFRQATLA